MSTQPESRLQRKIQDAIKAQGYFVFKVHGSEFMMAGLPDLIVCAEGLFIGLEVKLPATRSNTSARQDYVHGLINDAGGKATVVCSPDEALRTIQETIDENRVRDQ
jgi:Holliday junction resolvase